MKYELETMREIWLEDGEKIEIGPDRDGLNLVEIRYKNGSGQIISRFTFPDGAESLIAEAILKCKEELKSNE
jgi:hypothetical protein